MGVRKSEERSPYWRGGPAGGASTDREVVGSQSGRWASKAVISVSWRSVRPMSSRPFEQPVVVEVVELERLVEVDRGHRDPAVDDVDDDLERRVVLDRAHDPVDDVLAASSTGTRPIFRQLLRKMSAKRGEMIAWKP